MKRSQITGAGLVLLVAGLANSLPAMAADGSTKVDGRIYADFSVLSTDGNSAGDGYGVDVKRFYVGVTHKFDDTYSANVTTDFVKDTAFGKSLVYIKKAYFQINLNPMATLRLGSADLPWIPYVEGVYGLRYIENTITDWSKFGTSADWGVHLLGKNDMVDYQISVVNGKGYGDPTRSKSMDFSARVGFHPVQGLTLAVGARSGKLGEDTELTPTVNTATRLDVLATYKMGPAAVGVEYFSAKNFTKTAVSTGPEDKADGVSVFGSFAVNDTGKIFARVDTLKPSKDLDPTMKRTYYNLGYAYTPMHNVDLAFVYKNHKDEVAGTSVKSNEVGLWVRAKF